MHAQWQLARDRRLTHDLWANVSKWLDIEARFQWTTNAYGEPNGHAIDDVP